MSKNFSYKNELGHKLKQVYKKIERLNHKVDEKSIRRLNREKERKDSLVEKLRYENGESLKRIQEKYNYVKG